MQDTTGRVSRATRRGWLVALAACLLVAGCAGPPAGGERGSTAGTETHPPASATDCAVVSGAAFWTPNGTAGWDPGTARVGYTVDGEASLLVVVRNGEGILGTLRETTSAPVAVDGQPVSLSRTPAAGTLTLEVYADRGEPGLDGADVRCETGDTVTVP